MTCCFGLCKQKGITIPDLLGLTHIKISNKLIGFVSLIMLTKIQIVEYPTPTLLIHYLNIVKSKITILIVKQ